MRPGTLEEQLQQFLTLTLDRDEWSALPLENKRLREPQNWYGYFGEQTNPLSLLDITPQSLLTHQTHTEITISATPVFLNCRTLARYWALASVIPGRERISWNLSF